MSECVEMETASPLPEGDYAIVEIMGKRTYVGRVSEVTRFGASFLSIEPIFEGALLPPVLVGLASIYQFTACSPAVAARRGARYRYQLPPAVNACLPQEALPAPADEDDEMEVADDEDDDDELGPPF